MKVSPDKPGWVVVVGALALLVAIGASGILVMDHVGALSAPGCGGESDCHSAANGKFGSIPMFGVKWPVSFLGLAYFVAMLISWVSSRGEPGGGVRWIIRVGVLGSIFFIGVMIVEKLLCPYCLVSHVSNLAFAGAAEASGRRGLRSGFGRGLAAALGIFAAASMALGFVEADTKKAVAQKAVAEHTESTDAMVAQIRAAKAAKAEKAAREAAAKEAAAKAAQQPSAEAPFVLPSVFTGRYRFGPEVAPIRIVLFTGYQCPDCKNIEAQVEKLLNTRKDISISFKHFPFCPDCNSHIDRNMQPNGCWAARAAEAAGILKGPEGFKKMHIWLFARSGAFTAEDLTKALTEFGWDPVEFTQMMQGTQTLANVKQDIEEAVTYGLHYTPFIFINGIELKGWNVPDSLLSAVEKVTAAQPDAAGPSDDHPMRAGDKYVADWREQIAMDWPKRAKPYDVGSPYLTAKVKITLFGDLLEPNTAEADKTIRDYIAGRPEISYQFRYYPVDKSCNPSLPKTIFPLGCRAARAAEAAGQLGGTEAFWKMAQWIMNNRANYSDPLAKAQAGAMGLNADEFGKMMDSPEVDKLVNMDADIGKRIQLPEVPRIFVNGKVLPRWKLPGQFVIERVIEEAATPDAPGTK